MDIYLLCVYFLNLKITQDIYLCQCHFWKMSNKLRNRANYYKCWNTVIPSWSQYNQQCFINVCFAQILKWFIFVIKILRLCYWSFSVHTLQLCLVSDHELLGWREQAVFIYKHCAVSLTVKVECCKIGSPFYSCAHLALA